MGDEGVELVDGILILVPETGKADPHPAQQQSTHDVTVRTNLKGTPRTPWAQMALFRRVSILTSWNMDHFMNEPIECVHVTDLGSHLLLSKLLDLLAK